MKQYSNRQKAEILDECEKVGNVSKVAEKYGITRATIYNWKRDRESIEDSLSKDTALTAIKRSLGEEAGVLESVSEYSALLERVGDLEKRKKHLSSQVEFILWKVVKILETHEHLADMNPKDLSRVMVDLHGVRKDLSNEPTIVIEYRNRWIETVLQVLQEFLDEDQIREFAKKMQAVEAEYEIV